MMRSICCICESEKIKRLYFLNDDMFKDNLLLNVNKCQKCGLVFLDQEIYKHQKAIHEEYWQCLEEEYVQKDFDWIISEISKYKKNGRILEIGCGKGDLIIKIKSKGFEVYGVEISQIASRELKDSNIPVKNAPIEEVDYPADYFDYVIMYGVIEHVNNPYLVMKKINSWLRPSGGVMIYTPNVNSLFHKLAKYAYYLSLGKYIFPLKRMFVAMHTYYFNISTLSNLLTKTDYMVEYIKYDNIDKNIFCNYFKNRAWANNLLFKYTISLLYFFSNLLKMHSHILLTATKAK